MPKTHFSKQYYIHRQLEKFARTNSIMRYLKKLWGEKPKFFSVFAKKYRRGVYGREFSEIVSVFVANLEGRNFVLTNNPRGHKALQLVLIGTRELTVHLTTIKQTLTIIQFQWIPVARERSVETNKRFFITVYIIHIKLIIYFSKIHFILVSFKKEIIQLNTFHNRALEEYFN